jgi:two-component system OmpR family response regulator
MHILIVTGNDAVSQQLQSQLCSIGHSIERARLGAEAVTLVSRQTEPEAIIVATDLADMAPAEFVNVLRRQFVTAPIIVLGEMDEAEAVSVLDAGADDHVASAARAAEIEARLRAIARRARAGCARLRCGDLSIDLPTRTVIRNGEPILLTPREFALLELLARQCDRVVPRSLLRERIWGKSAESNGMNVVDVYVARLRRKLDPAMTSQRIRTIPGTGYMLLSSGVMPCPAA